ncbi:MAG: hypothetical protein E7311_07295 [Clostridiales bacterium]|nr:hypothetical protein [Clostridiales bacterium]
MKARIIKTFGFYYGQVCVKENKNTKEWKTVTEGCYTEFGARSSLRAWKKRYDKKLGYGEFEI